MMDAKERAVEWLKRYNKPNEYTEVISDLIAQLTDNHDRAEEIIKARELHIWKLQEEVKELQALNSQLVAAVQCIQCAADLNHAAFEHAAKVAEDTMEYLSSPLAAYNHGVMDARHAIAKAIRAL